MTKEYKLLLVVIFIACCVGAFSFEEELPRISSADTITVQELGIWSATSDRENAEVHVYEGVPLASVTTLSSSESSYGEDIAIDSNVLVVGAPDVSGASNVYIYDRLRSFGLAMTIAGNDSFGSSVTLEDGILAVGNPNSNQVNLYRLYITDGNFELLVTLSGVTSFGTKVAISDSFLAVSIPDQSTVGIYRLYDSFGDSKYTLLRNLFDPAGTGSSNGFGNAIAIGEANEIAIGAPFFNGNDGAVYVYGYTTSDFVAEGELQSNVSGSNFGSSLSLEGGVLMVGVSSGNLVFPFIRFGFEEGGWTAITPITTDGSATQPHLSGSVLTIGDNTGGVAVYGTAFASSVWEPLQEIPLTGTLSGEISIVGDVIAVEVTTGISLYVQTSFSEWSFAHSINIGAYERYILTSTDISFQNNRDYIFSVRESQMVWSDLTSVSYNITGNLFSSVLGLVFIGSTNIYEYDEKDGTNPITIGITPTFFQNPARTVTLEDLALSYIADIDFEKCFYPTFSGSIPI